MSWECAAPLWAWCCFGRGMSYGRRWRAALCWLQEEPSERRANCKATAKRRGGTSRRDELSAVHRATTGPRTGGGSFRAYTKLQAMPLVVARARTGIAAADARDV